MPVDEPVMYWLTGPMAVLLTLCNDSLCSSSAHSLDSHQAKTYLALGINAKVTVRFVHIRAHHIDAQSLALVQ